MSDERRRAERFRVWFPMRVEAQADGEMLAVSQNVSRTGLLVAIARRIEIGERVRLTFSVPPADDRQRDFEGQVVRYERNDRDPEGLWPYRVAVELDEPCPELEPLLEQARKRQSSPPSW